MKAVAHARCIASGFPFGTPLLRWLVVVALLLGPSRLPAQDEVPERPADYLLDQGGIFPPEMAQRIVKALKACARDYDVHIYVMTLPTIKVMPVRLREKVEELSKETRAQWLKGQVGAVMIFDNEAGNVTMGASAEAMKVFSPLTVNTVFKDPKLHSKKKHSPPEMLAGSVTLLIQHFVDLRAKVNEEARQRRNRQLAWGAGVGGLVLLGAGLIVVKVRAKKAARARHHRRHHH